MKTTIEQQDPGPEHFLLAPGEKIQPGDEYYSTVRGSWRRSLSYKVPGRPSYRRKVEKTFLPEDEYRILQRGGVHFAHGPVFL